MRSWAALSLRLEATDHEGLVLVRLAVVVDAGPTELHGPLLGGREDVEGMVDEFLDQIFGAM